MHIESQFKKILEAKINQVYAEDGGADNYPSIVLDTDTGLFCIWVTGDEINLGRITKDDLKDLKPLELSKSLKKKRTKKED